MIHPEDQTMIISQACCREEAEQLRQSILAEFHPRELLIVDLGPIIGAHTGPGLMALFFLAEHR